ncbi:hypothetical protein GCM10028857_29680 [Salinarchaeum chitinilyticum]
MVCPLLSLDMTRVDRDSFVRDAIVGTLTVVGLYGLGMSVQIPPVQIPAYLLIVGFDLLEVAFGSVGTYYDVVFAAYLLGVGVVGAATAHVIRNQADATGIPKWRFAVASVFVVVGGAALFFAVFISPEAGRISVLITGTTAVVLLGLAGWLTGLLDAPTAT